MRSRTARWVVAGLAVVAAVGLLLVRFAPTATAGSGPTTTAPAAAGGPDIVPQPNSGREPEDPGDPGGAGQLAVAAGVVVVLGGLLALAIRDVRRSRRVT